MKINKSEYVRIHNNICNVSVKIVVPTYCNAKCSFCFNQQQVETSSKDQSIFKRNLRKSIASLLRLLERYDRNDISFDITGNETTFDPEILRFTLETIADFKSRVGRVVLTTNGYRILDCLEFINKDSVDIVNFSVHHYKEDERKRIFGIKSIPKEDVYIEANAILSKKGISTTLVSVLNEPVNEDFKEYVHNLTIWAKGLGFNSIRLRSCFDRHDDFVIDYFKNTVFENEVKEIDVRGLYTRIVEVNDLEVRMLLGVNDLTNHVVGIEAVIDDDGKAYVDYQKRYPLSVNSWVYENVFLKKNSR